MQDSAINDKISGVSFAVNIAGLWHLKVGQSLEGETL